MRAVVPEHDDIGIGLVLVRRGVVRCLREGKVRPLDRQARAGRVVRRVRIAEARTGDRRRVRDRAAVRSRVDRGSDGPRDRRPLVNVGMLRGRSRREYVPVPAVER